MDTCRWLYVPWAVIYLPIRDKHSLSGINNQTFWYCPPPGSVWGLAGWTQCPGSDGWCNPPLQPDGKVNWSRIQTHTDASHTPHYETHNNKLHQVVSKCFHFLKTQISLCAGVSTSCWRTSRFLRAWMGSVWVTSVFGGWEGVNHGLLWIKHIFSVLSRNSEEHKGRLILRLSSA